MTDQIAQIDSTIDVVTPENIAFQYQVAGPFRRIPALLIDISVRAAVMFTMMLITGIAGLAGGFGGEVGFAVLLLTWFVMEWFYGGLLETFWNGQTVGKRMMGIRVLSVDGQPINGMQAVLRNILRLVDMMPLLPTTAFTGEPGPGMIPCGAIGLVAPLTNQRFQRLGDVVCGTMVIVEERTWITRTVKLEDPRTAQLAAALPAQLQVSRKLGQALAAYAERRRFLSRARRNEIARHLAQPMLSRFGLPEDTSYDLLLCALYYRTFVASKTPGAGQDAKMNRPASQPQPATVAMPASAATEP